MLVESGLVRWVNEKWEVIVPNLGLSAFEPELKLADDGTVWLLMPDALWHFSADLTRKKKVVGTSESERLISFCIDAQGDVWVVRSADCLPVLFCSIDGSEMAAAHAGWRGLAAGVLEATVANMAVLAYR